MPANPISVSYNTTGAKEPLNLDWLPFGAVTVAVVIVSGTATFGVEVTLDDVHLSDGTLNPNVRWIPLEDIPAGTAATIYTALYYPFQWIRLNIAAIAGAVEFKVMQASTSRF